MKSGFGAIALSVVVLFAGLGAAAGEGGAARRDALHVPRLDLELTGAEYRALLARPEAARVARDAEDTAIETYLVLGKRNLDWVDHVNSLRPAATQISLSSQASQGGSPVDHPSVYNFASVVESWAILRALLPASLKSVVFEGAPFTDQPPVTDREFIEWLRQVDAAYQTAARYKLMKPYLDELKQLSAYDVRGYLTLQETPDLDAQLSAWATLGDGLRDRFTRALVLICRNGEIATSACRAELAAAVSANTVVAFKDRYLAGARANYDSKTRRPIRRSCKSTTLSSLATLALPVTMRSSLPYR